MSKTRITTKSGFKCEVDTDVLTTWEFTEAVVMQNSDDDADKMTGYVTMTKLMLGKSGMQALKKHLSPDGSPTPLKKIDEELTEILKLVGTQIKKS